MFGGAGVGERSREGHKLLTDMQGSGVLARTVLVYGQMNEPPGARWRVPLTALTIAEHFRDQKHQNVLLLMDNVFRFMQVGSEISSLLGRLASRVGYQPTLATEAASLQERIASVAGAAVTAIQAVYVPADDFTDPAVTTILATWTASLCCPARWPPRASTPPSTRSPPPRCCLTRSWSGRSTTFCRACPRGPGALQGPADIISLLGVEELGASDRPWCRSPPPSSPGASWRRSSAAASSSRGGCRSSRPRRRRRSNSWWTRSTARSPKRCRWRPRRTAPSSAPGAQRDRAPALPVAGSAAGRSARGDHGGDHRARRWRGRKQDERPVGVRSRSRQPGDR